MDSNPYFYSAVTDAVLASLNSAAAFLPKLLYAIIILIVGVLVAALLKNLLVRLLEAIKLDNLLANTGIPQALKRTGTSVTNFLGELLRWIVILVFLVPAVETLGLYQVSILISNLVGYLPNVILAVIIILLGGVFAKFAQGFVLATAAGLGGYLARALSQVAVWSIWVFALLAALLQLGIAEDLIRILFTGLVAMLTIAGGLAFGLGGQGLARDMLNNIRDDISDKASSSPRNARGK